MSHKYIVDLTEDEQEYLLNLIKKGKATARKVSRAHVLLLADEGATDEEIAESLRLGFSTVHRTRQRFVEEGLRVALPEGRRRWTMQLLADRLIELQQVEDVSHDTVRRVLKKTTSNRGCAKSGASRA